MSLLTPRQLSPSLAFLRALLVLSLIVASTRAATYYIATNGSDSNNGTSTATPWATLNKANTTLVAGDTVLIRGGDYSGANAKLKASNNGTASNRIVYRAYPGTGDPATWESPVITGLPASTYAIDLTGRSYIVIDGLKVDGKQRYKQSSVYWWALLDGAGCHHNTIQNCTFKQARGWQGFQILKGSQYNKVLRNTFDFCGYYENADKPNEDYGDSFDLDGEYNLIEGNTFKHGGHNLMEIMGKFNVIRENVFDNDWSDVVGAGKGNRAMELRGFVAQATPNTTLPSQFNLFERNVVKNAGTSADTRPQDVPPMGMKVEGINQFVRFHYVFNNVHEAMFSDVRSKIAALPAGRARDLAAVQLAPPSP